MRHLISGLLIVLLSPAIATADEAAYRQQLYRYLTENARIFPEALRDRSIKVDVALTVGPDGKLLSAEIDQSTGSPEDNENVLTGLHRMQPLPHPPDDMQTPYKIKAPLIFTARARVGRPDLKWIMTPDTSGQEIAFRGDLLHHLQSHPRILPENMKLPKDVHSIVEFSVDQDGKLLNSKITKGFGLKTVDDETLAWLRAIQPFPKLPSELKAPMKLTVELVFGPKSIWDDEEARHKVSGVCRGC